MFKKEFTLYKLCLDKVAILLKTSEWNPYFEISDSPFNNPFSSLASTVIDELIVAVSRLSVVSKLKSTDLISLISTGRVTNFKLEDLQLTLDSLVDILMSLSFSSQSLVSFKISNVFCNEAFGNFSRRSDLRSEALECVLSNSPRLEYVESCIRFNLAVLRNCEHLRVLKLDFVPDTKLFDFLEESDGTFWVNNSLRVLEVYEDLRQPFSHVDIAIVLKHCTELVEFNCDISKSLEYLHEKELFSGSLNTQYKLQKCCLGNIFVESHDAALTRDSVYIATLTCPLLSDVDVLVNDPLTIYALSEFKNLTSLLLQFEAVTGGIFSESVPELLKKIGSNLRTFHLINFADVDFAVIGINCPNLEEFRIEYLGSFNQSEFTSTCFRNVTNLHVENIIDSGFCDSKTICGLLSNCYDLESFNLLTADGLNDSALNFILRKNKLFKVKESRILNCSLSPTGIQNLASSLNSLEYLEISSSLVPFDDIAAIVHAINAEVIISNVL